MEPLGQMKCHHIVARHRKNLRSDFVCSVVSDRLSTWGFVNPRFKKYLVRASREIDLAKGVNM